MGIGQVEPKRWPWAIYKVDYLPTDNWKPGNCNKNEKLKSVGFIKPCTTKIGNALRLTSNIGWSGILDASSSSKPATDKSRQQSFAWDIPITLLPDPLHTV